jgi:HEPN domain-containing protein
LVGLTVSRTKAGDPVDEVIRRDAFQRSAVELARATGDVIAGQVGDHGVVFLSAATGSAERKRRKLIDLAERAANTAQRRFGLSLHCGMSAAVGSAPLSRSYQAALGVAESALAQGVRLIIAEPSPGQPTQSLRELREELNRVVEEKPELLGAKFDRYLETLAVQSGYRIDAVRGYLEAGFERLAEPLVGSGALDRKSFRALCDVHRFAQAAAARSMNDLFSAYRSAVADLSEAVRKPVPARQDRSLRSAIDYIHSTTPTALDFKKVARVAGFSPAYSRALPQARKKDVRAVCTGPSG